MIKSISFIAVSTLLLAQVCFAEDWPRWRGVDGNATSSEKGLLQQWPQGGPKQLWAAEVGRGYASPIAAGGKVYLISTADKKDTLTAFDANTGKVIWSQTNETAYAGQYPGARASAAIDGDRIYTYGADGKLVCRQLSDGTLVWSCDVLGETHAQNIQWGMASNPLITADRIYVQSGAAGPVAVAVDKATGKIAWQAQEKGPGSYAAPVIADVKGKKQLFVFGAAGLIDMDAASGQTLWTYPWRTSYDINAASPLVKGDQVFITTAYDHGSAMLDISGAAPKVLWESKDIQAKFQPPILDGDVMYLASESKAAGGGTVCCVNWADGAIKWKASASDMRIGPGGSMVRFGDKLITLGDHGRATLMLATPEKFEKISQFSAVEGSEVWSAPAIHNGKLYLKGANQLICFDISGK